MDKLKTVFVDCFVDLHPFAIVRGVFDERLPIGDVGGNGGVTLDVVDREAQDGSSIEDMEMMPPVPKEFSPP